MAKYTEKQIAEIFIQSLEEAKETAKKNEKLTKQIEENLSIFSQDFLNKLKSVNLKLDDNKARETIIEFEKVHQNAKKGLNLTYFAYSLILVSVLILGISFFTFYLNVKTRIEIRSEYQQELIKKGQFNAKEDALYLEKFRYWREKNPKNTIELDNSIESSWKKR